MKIYMGTTLEGFEAWSGGEDTLEVLRDKDMCDTLEAHIERDIFPDGCTDTELNDFLWFERDTIANLLGFSDWEALENDGEEEEEVGGSNFVRWCNNFADCVGCPYEKYISLNDCELNFYYDNPEQEDDIRLYQ